MESRTLMHPSLLSKSQMIDLIALKDFLVLCQTKSFSRAAERCHVSVSGLSRRIQSLEQWLGMPVFDRRKQALELTDAGRRLQAVSSEVVFALDGLRKSLRSDGERQALDVRFAAPHVMSAVFFPDWMPRMHGAFGAAKFSVHSDLLPDCFQMLDEGSTDFVVALFDAAGGVEASLGDRSLAQYQTLDLDEEWLLPVCAPNATGGPLFNLKDRSAEPVSFLGYAPECHLGWGLQPLLAAHPDLPLDQRHTSTLTDGLRLMAVSGLGVAWLPETMVRHDLDSRRLVRAGDASFDVPLRLTVLRRSGELTTEAERVWRYLGAMADAERSSSNGTTAVPLSNREAAVA